MNETFIFLIKIFIPSLIVSVIIKYLGSFISIQPSNIKALIMVMILPSIVALFLSQKLLNNISNS